MDDELLGKLRDPERLRALADTELLDSEPEERFDRYTRLLCEILGTPVALVSLVDRSRQFFKSAVGLGEPWATLRETPLSLSFCKYAVASGKPLIVNDAPDHPLVREHPAVRELGVMAYAGVPLTSAGQGVGVLCVVDEKPREWTARDLHVLHALASAVTAEIELSRVKHESAERVALLNAITESALDGIITTNGEGAIVFCNAAVESIFGYARAELHGRPVTELMPERSRDVYRRGLRGLSPDGTRRVIGTVVELEGQRANREAFPIELSLSAWTGRAGKFYTAVVRDISERSRALRALSDAEEQLRLTVDKAPIGMALVGVDGRFLRVNDAFCKIVGYSREALLSIDFQRISHPEDLIGDLRLVNDLVDAKITSYTLEKRYIHKAGHHVTVLLSVSLARRSDGQPSFFVAQISDISDRLQAEAQADLFFERSVDMLAIFGTSGKFERVNGAWNKALGFAPEDLLGRPYLEFVHEDDREITIREAQAIATSGRGTPGFRNRYRSRTGELHWFEWTSNLTLDGKLFCIARDVTEKIALEEQIREASLIDELTGLKNRRGFMLLGEQLLDVAVRYGRKLFVVFADLNGLKRINDEIGHDAGDRAIIEMAEVLRATFRKVDVLARLGGDEFVVLAEGDASVGAAVRERLESNLRERNAMAARPYELSASLGVAHLEGCSSPSLAELVATADKLMYAAKRKRKNRPSPASESER